MAKASFCVWVWLDENDDPIYVGWGRFVIKHPAKFVWATRDAYDSELNRWLRTLDREPDRQYSEDNAVRFSRTEASAQANHLRRQLKQQGYNLLDSRPDNTKSGGGSSRGVLSPDLEIFDSVRKAATAYGVNPSSVTRWCKDADNDWNYLS